MYLKNIKASVGILGMILSYFIPHPYVGEFLLWFSWGYLFVKSKIFKRNDCSQIFLFIITGYIFLFLIQVIFNYQGSAWLVRLYGLTKNLMMLELMMLISPLIHKETAQLCQLFVIIVVCTYIVQSDIITNYVSANGMVALFVALLPISIYWLIYKQSLISIIGLVLLLPLLMLIDSETFLIIIIIELILLFIFFATSHRKADKNLKMLLKIIIFVILITCILGVCKIIFDASFQQKAFNFMLKLNQDRAYIWNLGFAQFNAREQFHYLFGNGDNYVQMRYMLQAGHNAVLEELMIYGIGGLLLFFLESYALYKSVYKKITTKRERYFAIAVTAGVYVEFFAHPFYSTYFILKIIYISFMTMLIRCSTIRNIKADNYL